MACHAAVLLCQKPRFDRTTCGTPPLTCMYAALVSPAPCTAALPAMAASVPALPSHPWACAALRLTHVQRCCRVCCPSTLCHRSSAKARTPSMLTMDCHACRARPRTRCPGRRLTWRRTRCCAGRVQLCMQVMQLCAGGGRRGPRIGGRGSGTASCSAGRTLASCAHQHGPTARGTTTVMDEATWARKGREASAKMRQRYGWRMLSCSVAKVRCGVPKA